MSRRPIRLDAFLSPEPAVSPVVRILGPIIVAILVVLGLSAFGGCRVATVGATSVDLPWWVVLLALPFLWWWSLTGIVRRK